MPWFPFLSRHDRSAGFPLEWEGVLWSARPKALTPLLRGEQYDITDFRAVRRSSSAPLREIALHDIDRIQIRRPRFAALFGASDLIITSHRKRDDPLVFRGIVGATELATLLQRLASLNRGSDVEEVAAARRRLADRSSSRRRGSLGSVLALLTFLGVAIGLHGRELPISFPADDAIYPGGEKKSREEIVAFMNAEVMPFARRVLGPIKGGADNVTCKTCHGEGAEARGWAMPGVPALPEPDFRMAAMEQFASPADAQLRNAIYGDLAELDNQPRAVYMRRVVMPGMARLLHRPAYDFTKPYNYNRTRFALGCYHCHRVSASETQ